MMKKATKPRPKMAKFVLTTWAACLARQKPVSTSAKPACMKITSTAPITTQRMLVAMPRPTVVDVSGGGDFAAAQAPPLVRSTVAERGDPGRRSELGPSAPQWGFGHALLLA